MATRTGSRTSHRSDLDALWRRFKTSRAEVIHGWVEAERAMALANQEGRENGTSGDRLLAAEAALQSAIIDFAATQESPLDPMPVALALLRKAERELFDVPPDLRRPDAGGDRRKTVRRGVGDRRAS
jgi:hypothetical protein